MGRYVTDAHMHSVRNEQQGFYWVKWLVKYFREAGAFGRVQISRVFHAALLLFTQVRIFPSERSQNDQSAFVAAGKVVYFLFGLEKWGKGETGLYVSWEL